RTFRRRLLKACQREALTLYNAMGPNPKLERSLVTASEALQNFKWTSSINREGETFLDQTILEALADTELETGLALNPLCIGVAESVVERSFNRFDPTNRKYIVGERLPGFLQSKEISPQETLKSPLSETEFRQLTLEKPHLRKLLARYKRRDENTGVISYVVPDILQGNLNPTQKTRSGSADFSPVYYTRREALLKGSSTGRVLYCRNLFPADLLANAAAILNVAGAVAKRFERDGAWQASRLFSVVPELDQLTQLVSNWAKSLNQGVKSTTDAIKAFIDFLQARIIELRNLINQIDAFLQVPLSFDLGQLSILPVFGEGTQGVLSEFVGASNKPQDPATAYAAGAVILIGGAPTFIADLIKLVDQ
ncbi:MAG: hypothetical protein AAGM67_12050, partial [Bacteroidota bacterium]